MATTESAQPVPVNMYEADEAVVVVAPLPGVMPGDIDLRVEGQALVISASQRTPAVKDYLLHEWHYGPYERRGDLPGRGQGEIHATLGNGQLARRRQGLDPAHLRHRPARRARPALREAEHGNGQGQPGLTPPPAAAAADPA